MPEKIIFTGGGSGGHVYPLLSVAEALKKQEAELEVVFLVGRSKDERVMMKDASDRVYYIFSGKLRRYFAWQTFWMPVLVLLGFWQSWFLLMKLKPRAVFSKGGFVAVPVCVAAFLLRVPVITHESDLALGLANKCIQKIASHVYTGFDLGNKRARVVGNPIRPELLKGDRNKMRAKFKIPSDLPVVLVLCGSRGSLTVNVIIRDILKELTALAFVVHVVGRGNAVRADCHNYKQLEYAGSELKDLYALCDVVVCRAGANVLTEVALLGKPAVILPLRGSASNHQELNAKYFAERNAAVVLTADLLDSKILLKSLKCLLVDGGVREELHHAIRSICIPDSALVIARQLKFDIL